MFCNHCGSSLPDDAVFCNICGQRVGDVIESTTLTDEQKTDVTAAAEAAEAVAPANVQPAQNPAPAVRNNKGLIIAVSASAAVIVCAIIAGFIILANSKSAQPEVTLNNERSAAIEVANTAREPAETTVTTTAPPETTTTTTAYQPTQAEIEASVSEELTSILKGAKYNQALQYLASYGIPDWQVSYVTDEGGSVLAPSNWAVTSVKYTKSGTTVYLTRCGYVPDSIEGSVINGIGEGVEIGIAGSIADLFF